MPARLEFDLSLGPAATARRPARDGEPMRLLLLGDFSGGARGPESLAQRPTLRVDVDNLDDVMRRLAPRIELQVAGVSCTFAPASLDDFHPDRLIALLPPLSRGHDLLRRLGHSATFAQAAAELGAAPAAPQGAAPAAASSATPVSGSDLLGSLLGGKPAAAATTTPAAAPAQGIDALLRGIVAPHIVRDAAPGQASYVAAAEAALAEQLRAVLHAPAFQALEASWRSVQWLVSGLELDDALQLHLFDLRRDELAADIVAAQGELPLSGLYAALVARDRGQPGAARWSSFVALQSFGPGDADIALLAALGVVAAQAAAPVLATAQPALLGWSSFAQAGSDAAVPNAGWLQLRGSEVAPWIGLCAPRVLLRLPYGRRADPVDTFGFEEFASGAPEHAHYLWGASSVAAALLIGRAFSANGWQMTPGDEREIGDLPAYSFDKNGEPELQACAEHYLGDAAAQALQQAGLVPLLSHRHRNAVLLPQIASIAEPRTALAGPWSGG